MLVVHQTRVWVSDKATGSWTHQLTASIWDRVDTEQQSEMEREGREREKNREKESFLMNPPPPQSRLKALSPLLRGKREMNPAIVMFHLLQSHPKKYKAPFQLL